MEGDGGRRFMNSSGDYTYHWCQDCVHGLRIQTCKGSIQMLSRPWWWDVVIHGAFLQGKCRSQLGRMSAGAVLKRPI